MPKTCFVVMPLLMAAWSMPVTAQVKDAAGSPLGVGRPAHGAIADFNGGRIETGRKATCQLHGRRQPCVFYPRNGDGSFAVDIGGRAYYADRTASGRVSIDYDNGARLVPQGIFVRSRSDRGCWSGPARTRLCVW